MTSTAQLLFLIFLQGLSSLRGFSPYDSSGGTENAHLRVSLPEVRPRDGTLAGFRRSGPGSLLGMRSSSREGVPPAGDSLQGHRLLRNGLRKAVPEERRPGWRWKLPEWFAIGEVRDPGRREGQRDKGGCQERQNGHRRVPEQRWLRWPGHLSRLTRTPTTQTSRPVCLSAIFLSDFSYAL